MWLHILGKQRLAYLSYAAGVHGIRCVTFGAVLRPTRRKSGMLVIELAAIINALLSLYYLPTISVESNGIPLASHYRGLSTQRPLEGTLLSLTPTRHLGLSPLLLSGLVCITPVCAACCLVSLYLYYPTYSTGKEAVKPFFSIVRAIVYLIETFTVPQGWDVDLWTLLYAPSDP